MKKEILYSLKGIYRENFEIEGYSRSIKRQRNTAAVYMLTAY